MSKYNLSEGSKSYHEEADIYERFSQVEDTPNLVRNFLEQFIEGKKVLDVGCGTGKYLTAFAPLSKCYYGLDISQDQLNIAQKKACGLNNATFLCSSAENIDLPSNSVDVVLSTWVLGTILDANRRKAALAEIERVLKQNGQIYLVENDIGGEFEEIRGRYPDTTRTKEYNSWLEEQGFKMINRVNTYFEFESVDEAKSIFGCIWGDAAAEKIKSSIIEHKVIIYNKSK